MLPANVSHYKTDFFPFLKKSQRQKATREEDVPGNVLNNFTNTHFTLPQA